MKMHFTYKNYRGEVSKRTVVVHHVRFLSTEWHPEKQWIITALDTAKGELRDFAMNDMSEVHPTPTLFLLTADILRQMMGRLNELQRLVGEVGAGPVDDMLTKVTETKAMLQGLLKGNDATESSFLPEKITPEIRDVLRMPPWRIASLADALRAAGHNIGRREDDATAAVKFLLLHFVLREGANWHKVFRTFTDAGASDAMKFMHTLPGHDELKLEAESGNLTWKGIDHAKATCFCGEPISDELAHFAHTPVSLYDYVMNQPEPGAKESGDDQG